MTVYLLRAGDTEKVKIGFALDVEERRKSLQAGCWETLILIRTWEGDRLVEGWLHRQFPHVRIARDWFRWDDAMLTIEAPSAAALMADTTIRVDPQDLLRATHGLITKIASGLGITKSAVSMWNRVPAERVAAVSRITGIPRHALRPDLFGVPFTVSANVEHV